MNIGYPASGIARLWAPAASRATRTEQRYCVLSVASRADGSAACSPSPRVALSMRGRPQSGLTAGFVSNCWERSLEYHF